MKPSDETMLSFYRQLGRIFYGIANADNVVREEEVQILKTIVKKDWIGLDDTHDAFGTDSAYRIEVVFDWLTENDWNKEEILPQFQDFRNEHPSLFTPPVEMLILNTVNNIADSFYGMNKAEVNYLMTLSDIVLGYK